MKKFGLLPRILVAIVLGIVLARVLPLWGVRVFLTFTITRSYCCNAL